MTNLSTALLTPSTFPHPKQDAARGSRAYDPATGAFLAPRWSAADELLEDPLRFSPDRLFPDNDPVNGLGKHRRRTFHSYEGNFTLREGFDPLSCLSILRNGCICLAMLVCN